MKPIVLYFRISTTDQNLQSQIDDLNKWAKSNNYKVVKQFGETVSGYDQYAERIEYDNMKKYVIQQNIKDIAVWEISRLSRSMVKLVNEIDFFTKNKINIHFKKENLDSLSDNATNKLVLQILGAMAELERNSFIERGKRGRMTAVLKGRMIGYSTPPYGYTSDSNGIIAIEPKEAKVIKLIYELLAKGQTLYGLSQHLNSLNIPTRKKLQGRQKTLPNGNKVEILWKPSVISRLIHYTIYKGIRIYKGIEIKYPAIVDEALWNKVQERFKNNIGYHNKTKYDYLFKSKMKCGKCNRVMVTYKYKGVDYAYYLCTGISDLQLKCRNGRYINSKMIDDNIYNCLFDHKYIKVIIDREASPTLKKAGITEQIKYYNDEIEGLENKRKRYTKMYADGYINYSEFEKEIASLQNQILNHQSNISILQNELLNITKIDINSIIKTYKNATDFNVKRDFVVKYVNDIKIFKLDTANVKWQYPLHKNEKIIYVEVYAFNHLIPIKVILTPYSKNVIISNDLLYLPDFNTVVDINQQK